MKRKPAKKSDRGKPSKSADQGDGFLVEEMPKQERKRMKQLQFLSKLKDKPQVLSARNSVIKKKRKRTREKAAKLLDSLPSLAESLPSTEEILESTQTVHKKMRQRASHQQVIAKETTQLAAVLAHPEFQNNPFVAIQQHLSNTLPSWDQPTEKQQQQAMTKKGKPLRR